jgi:hypothetical protein
LTSLTNILSEDPTLIAVDKAIEEKAEEETPRGYLGFSNVGEECWRYLQYAFLQAYKRKPPAFLVKCAERGHRAEELQAQRLRMVDGVELTTVGHDGKQIEFSDVNGHFKGHCDGVITGLLQAPKTPHVWEHKEKEQKFVNEFNKIKAQLGEKQTLKKFDPIYYAQAALYMLFLGLKRHYITISTPGGRDTYSARTEADDKHAEDMREKAKKIIYGKELFEKIGGEDYFKCKMCDARGVCHGGEMPERGCRTCTHSSPIEHGAWRCERFGRNLTLDEQIAGCPAHIYLKMFVPGEVIAATDKSITYRFKDGRVWTDSEAK